MRSNQPNRRRSFASLWLGWMLLLLVASGGVVAILFLLGIAPFGGSAEDPFMVRIPINSRAIPAYQRVTREDLLNPATGSLAFQRVPPKAVVGMSAVGVASDGSHVEGRVDAVRNVSDQVVLLVGQREVPHGQLISLGGALMNVNAIIGRVVKKDKRIGMAFQESTFFPQGTPEGIAGATPPGMRAMTLDATKLTGVHALQAGDEIDLMASVPIAESSSFRGSGGGNLPAGSLVVDPSRAAKDPSAATEPLLLAQGAVVLKPVYIRNEATTSSSLTQGKRVQNVPKYEVAIAVLPDDVIPLQNALNKTLEITCIAHSMQPASGQLEDRSLVTAEKQQLVPVTVRAIPAYEVVSREAFVSPATRRMRMEPVDQREIDRQGMITSLDEVLGAVARHDIPAGRFLRRVDLLTDAVRPRSPPVAPRRTNEPRGSSAAFVRPVSDHTRFASARQADEDSTAPTVVGDRPAITRFVPEGYTAFAIPWNRLYGAEHLQIGDRLDLLASFSLESENQEEETETRPDGTKIVRKRQDQATRKTLRTWDESLGQRGETWFAASDALVVGPVGFPAPAAALRALGGQGSRPSAGGDGTNWSGPPLLIAVDDRDVETLAAALASKRVLFTPAFHSSAEPGLESDSTNGAPAREKRIAIAAQDVAAYESMSESVWNGNRRRPMTRLVEMDDPRYLQALTLEELQGYERRVLATAKRRGEFFTEADFLPEGSLAGVAAAAHSGETVFAVADREIEGLDTFQAGDMVAILVRGVARAPEGTISHGLGDRRPVAAVVVPAARIVRATRGGQTVLSVSNRDLTRLQSAWAAAHFGEADQGGRRSHLLAVGKPRDPASVHRNSSDGSGPDAAAPAPTADSDPIPSFDAWAGTRRMEVLVGKAREVHAFPAEATDASGGMVFDFARQE